MSNQPHVIDLMAELKKSLERDLLPRLAPCGCHVDCTCGWRPAMVRIREQGGACSFCSRDLAALVAASAGGRP